jgi:non-specific protein-tyrosine kinase
MKEALEKAIEAKEHAASRFIRDDIPAPANLRSKRQSRNKTRALKEVNIVYSATKVNHIHPKILKRNRVFSLFQQNEMNDQINLLRSQIMKKLEEIGGNSFIVTSARQGEGKSFVSINLGISLARELDHTVMLVDGDLRSPSRNHCDFSKGFFGLDVKKGLSDYLLGQMELSDLLINPGIPKLTILPAGKPMPNSAELLRSGKMLAMFEEMKSRYPDDRIIILDSPSLLCADPLILSHYVDGILLVVEEASTNVKNVKRAMELLRNKIVLGTVFNKAKYGKLSHV